MCNLLVKSVMLLSFINTIEKHEDILMRQRLISWHRKIFMIWRLRLGFKETFWEEASTEYLLGREEVGKAGLREGKYDFQCHYNWGLNWYYKKLWLGMVLESYTEIWQNGEEGLYLYIIQSLVRVFLYPLMCGSQHSLSVSMSLMFVDSICKYLAYVFVFVCFSLGVPWKRTEIGNCMQHTEWWVSQDLHLQV